MIDIGSKLSTARGPRRELGSTRRHLAKPSLASKDPVHQYLSEIAAYPLLTRREERALCERIRSAQHQLRRAILSHPIIVQQVAELLLNVAQGQIRAERVLDVRVNNLPGKRKLRNIAALNGLTLQGISRTVTSGPEMTWSTSRRARIIRLVEETQIKTRQLLSIWRDSLLQDDEVSRKLSDYQRLRNDMVTANLRLAVSVARKFRHQGMSFLDLIQEASTGLFRAVDAFDPQRELKFSTYAVWWAKQSVHSAIADKGRLIRVGQTAAQKVREVNSYAQMLHQRHERSPQLEDVANTMDQTCEQLRHYWNVRLGISSLDTQTGPTSDESYGDLLTERHPSDLLGNLVRSDHRRLIRRGMRGLKPNERQVVKLRFGLRDGVYRSLAEVGREMSLTRERIRQLEKSSLRKLRELLSTDGSTAS